MKEIKYIVQGASELEINNAVSELRKQYPDYDIFVTSDEEDVLGPVQYSELWTGAYFFTTNQDDWDAIEKFCMDLFPEYKNY